MKAGDQFLSVERLPLTSATHKEAVALISSRKKVIFKINKYTKKKIETQN